MKHNTIMRDGMGRIVGSIEDYWNNDEYESYEDHKINSDDVRFPQHFGDLNGECVTYHISKLK